ncbi:hypothetical protein VTO42DRAFT_3545 [Malbranchea cinnamomea]
METIAKSTNTYVQRRRKELYKDTVIKGRSWKPTTAAELRVFLGILIYIGVHKSPSIYDYFRNPESVEEMQPQHSTYKYMTTTRFEQLKRFIHISDPCGDELRGPGEKDWWFKLEPLTSTFQEASKRYYKPSSNLALDEIMIRCFARSHHTVKMPNKPIQQGYKIFALAERGSEQSQRRKREKGDLSPTAKMVIEMIQAVYSIYMDNYFNTVPLYKKLLEVSYGACGTARPTSGVPEILLELKNNHSKALPWGSLYAKVEDDILCLAWQDNNIVLGLSTLHSPTAFIAQKRKRPAKTSTNEALVRRVFGDEVIKELDIPAFINDYNHYMGAVDVSNQLRANYTVHRKTYRNWLPLFYFFIDAVVVNAFRI